jgi:hypothetical protein
MEELSKSDFELLRRAFKYLCEQVSLEMPVAVENARRISRGELVLDE